LSSPNALTRHRPFAAALVAACELRVTAVGSGTEMDHVLEREAVDCIVLDLKLPGEDGLAIAHRLRDQGSIPMMLTGRAEEAECVMGLSSGPMTT
jgi:two-component system OmpR family response regulator